MPGWTLKWVACKPKKAEMSAKGTYSSTHILLFIIRNFTPEMILDKK
jgi:hypothetical protein